MKPVRGLYDNLPVEARSTLRSWLPKRLLRWYAHRNTDVYLVSYPKCGRTWLRLMIGRAVARHFALPENDDILLLNWKSKSHPEVPKITVVHDDRPMLKTPDELQTSKEKYRDKDVIFLVRDPRDVIVSSYFEMKKRGRIFGENPYETRQAIFDGTLPEFIDRRAGGFDTIIKYYNIWADQRRLLKGFLLIRYEDMKKDAEHELRRVLDFLGLGMIDHQTIAEAAVFASFDNVHKMEAQGAFQSGILKPADETDRDSFKTRKGKVGGFVDYLNEQEIQTLNQRMNAQLSDIFGYTQNPL
ncbi:MAG: sulfotransferase domain-containing protein [Anaerolineales bacterium]|nr:sulfotransferase domain-containing protein [Anaerolineales bacterium]